MQKLSRHYRNDNTDGLPHEVRQYLDTHYLANLEHIDEPHSKLLVVFSGGSAMGKSTLSTRIKNDLHALVLENDGIKRSLQSLNPDYTRDEQSKLTWQYSMELYARLPEITRNGFVVRDAVIDWYYDRILPGFIEQGYTLFIIAYDLSLERRIELIKKRGDTEVATVKRFISLLEDHDIHMARFRSDYTPDIILTNDNLFDYDPVIDAIKHRLESI